MKFQDDSKAYLFEASQMRSLNAIRERLYDDKPLSGDQRCDLANTLDALMFGAAEIDLQKFKWQ
jgi:hypothetical protein